MRARLNERLARAMRFPVTLLIAPAGFGKSVALRDFIETRRLDALRYDVRREDTTLLAFARGLAETLAPLAPGLLAAFPAVQQRLLATDDPVPELVGWFAEHLRRTVATVVVDDLHYAASAPFSVSLLVELVERTAGRISWIIASRSDAGLPIGSWIGYGRVDLPIGEDDLRFTADEALATAEDGESTLDAREVEELRQLTGGWPIALAIALRTRMHAADLRSAASGTREMVYRYLAEQVFSRLTRPQQRFLLRTCVFPSFDLALAESCGADAPFLAELRSTVAFLNAISEGTYRYHDLFRDFLERELRGCGAAAWYDALVDGGEALEARGDAVGALELYVRAGANDPILRIVNKHGFALFERGAAETLAGALAAIPEQTRRENATALGIVAAIDASRGRFDLAQQRFIAAIASAGDEELRLALIHRYALELVRQDRDAIELLELSVREHAPAPRTRIPLLGTLATAYLRAARVDEAFATIAQALEGLEPLGDEDRARIYQQAAYVHQFAPSRERARSYAIRAAELAMQANLYEVAARAYSVLYTIVNDEDDDPIASLAILDRLGEAARKGASRQVRMFGVIASYAIEVERGDDDAIARLDVDLDGALDVLPRANAETLLPALALRRAWQGDFRAAHELLSGSAAQQGSDERRALRAGEEALYALAAGARDKGDGALADATSWLERCSRPTLRLARANLIVAFAELARGRASAAHRRIVDAERIAAPSMRRVRALAHAARTLQRVALGQADRSSVAAALERLRAEHLGGFARLLTAIPFPAHEERSYAHLSAAEREILALLATGASSKDVARRTNRSPQTVDTHIRSICRKLRCRGRREAVALALSAGWISASG